MIDRDIVLDHFVLFEKKEKKQWKSTNTCIRAWHCTNNIQSFYWLQVLRIYLVDPFFPYHAALTRSIESEFAKYTQSFISKAARLLLRLLLSWNRKYLIRSPITSQLVMHLGSPSNEARHVGGNLQCKYTVYSSQF